MNSIISKLESVKIYKLVCLVFLIFFTNIVEVFSISLIIPIFSLLQSDNLLEIEGYSKFIFDFFQIYKYEQLVVYSSIFIILVFIFKFFLTIITGYSIVNITAKLKVEISMKILRHYLNQNYDFFLNTNSNHLTQNVIHEPRIFSDKFFLASMYFFSDFVMLFFIIIFLLIFNIKITLILIFSSFLLTILYLKFTKKKVIDLGTKRGHLEKKIIGITKDLFHSIKEVKNYSAENFFYNSLKPKNIENEKNYKMLYLLQLIPRPSLELLSMIGLFSVILLNFYIFKYDNLISLLAVFVASLFKIIPACTRVIGSYQDIKFSSYAVNFIKHIFENLQNPSNSSEKENKSIFRDNIYLKNISFKYKNSEKTLFENLELKINKGDFMGIVGSSGSGKSTLVDVILGLQNINSGEVLIDNVSIEKLQFYRPNIFGYVPQKIFLFNDTIAQNIAIGVPPAEIDRNLVLNSLKRVNLLDHFEQFKGLETELNEMGTNLSGGQIQRVGIARSLYFDTSLVVFDESTNQLDEQNEKIILNLINKLSKEKTVIFISHKLENLKNCNRIIKINNGTINEKN